jgi:hypothetical protein
MKPMILFLEKTWLFWWALAFALVIRFALRLSTEESKPLGVVATSQRDHRPMGAGVGSGNLDSVGFGSERV